MKDEFEAQRVKRSPWVTCNSLVIVKMVGTEKIKVAIGIPRGGGHVWGVQTTPFWFFLLACVSKRLVMYEDTPMPCWPSNFEEGKKTYWSPPTPTQRLFHGWRGIMAWTQCLNTPLENILGTPMKVAIIVLAHLLCKYTLLGCIIITRL